MVEHFQPERPSWTSATPERRQQHRAQLQTSGECVFLLDSVGEVAKTALTVSRREVFVSDVTPSGQQQRERARPLLKNSEMAPRRQSAAQRSPAAEDCAEAVQHGIIVAEHHAAGQHPAGGRADETVPSAVHGRREKHNMLCRERGRLTAVKDRTSSSFEDKATGDALERTPSSSPSLSWEDVEDSLAGINAYAIRHGECQSSTQRACRHQHVLRSRADSGTFVLPAAHEPPTPPFPDRKLQLVPRATVPRARAYSTADGHRRSGWVEPNAAPRLSNQELRGSGASSTTASSFGAATCRATSRRKVGDANVEEGSERACSATSFPVYQKRRETRRRAVSCPGCSEHPLQYAYHSALSWRSYSGPVAAWSAVASGDAGNKRGPLPRCVQPVSTWYTAGQDNFFRNSPTSESSSLRHCQQLPEGLFGSYSAVEASRRAKGQSDSGQWVRTAASSGNSSRPHSICPFYARGLCPAGAAAAAAIRTPLPQGKAFAESPAAEGGSFPGVATNSVTASSTRDGDASPEHTRGTSAHRCAGAPLQPATGPPECDACSYCMDTCDHISCTRCLPRRGHPDALPPYSFNKESSTSPSSEAGECRLAIYSAGESQHLNPCGEETGAFSSRTLDPRSSPGGSTDKLSPSAAATSSPCYLLPSQTEDIRLSTRSALVEESQLAHSRTTNVWVRTASAPASGVKPEKLEKKNTVDGWRFGGGWLPCSWFPYRCLRALAPPARPLVTYTQCQVDRYCRNGGCWLLANGLIYDALPILYAHPGGPSCLLRKRGQDCSRDFSFHSKRGQQLWNNFIVGRLKPCKGWTARKHQQKEHFSAAASREGRVLLQGAVNRNTSESEFSRTAEGAGGSAHVSPGASVRGPREVGSAAEWRREQGNLSRDTPVNTRDILNDGETERSDRSDIYGEPSVAEGASRCRVM